MARKVLSGLSVSPGVAEGRVCVIRQPEDWKSVRDGDIVFVPKSHPLFAMAVVKAAGLVCEEGGRLSHICIVSLEMGIPCITNVTGALDIAESLSHVRLDAGAGAVYDAS